MNDLIKVYENQGPVKLRSANGKWYWIIYLSYLVSFILCSIIAVTFQGNAFVEICSFLLVFGAAFIVNAFYISKSISSSSLLEKHFKLDKVIIKNTFLLSVLFDRHGQILISEVGNKFAYEHNTKVMIEDILSMLHIPLKVQNEIKEIITASDVRNIKMKYLGSYEYKGEYFDVIIKVLDEEQGTKILYIQDSMLKSSLNSRFKDSFIGFYELNHNLKLVNCNKYFAKILGYKPAELISSDVKIDDLILLDESVDSLLLNSKAKKSLQGNWQGLLTFNTKYKEKVHCFIVQKATLNHMGRVESVIGYVLKLQDKSLLHRPKGVEKGWIEYSWKSFFESSIHPVIIADSSGVILKANSAFFELVPGDYIGKGLREIATKDYQTKIESEIGLMAGSNEQLAMLKNFYIRNVSKPLDIYLNKIKDMEGNSLGFMVSINDNTHQRELEDRLSHAQRMQTIGQLVGAVAHDFNNLLTAITGFCDILLLRHGMGDPSFVNIIQIKQSSDRASNLVKRLLAFSRKQTLKLEVIYLNEFFSDITALIQRLVGADIVVKKDININTWPVKFDPVQLEQVVLNLIVNAHQAMVSGGHIQINVKNVYLNADDSLLVGYSVPPGEEMPPVGEYVSIEFIDDGSGIPSEIIKHIFEPFFTTKLDKSGTGLGLSTVYGIVRQSEGFIFVKSTLGEGSNFLILLKRHIITGEELLETKKQQIINLTYQDQLKRDLSGKGVIALVEDEEAVRLFAKSALISKGYDVIEFDSAKNALREIQKDLPRIDLIISDVMMPEMNGPEFISEIHKTHQGIKVIFMSGYGEDAFTEEYGNKRDFHFLPKPFSLKQLVGKVKEVLSLST